ncbi:hypothetical protein [Actinokineospora enzanensis]|uniref:hypothetical protein n=1 Tax=Actinokineospora enzanensis TaxID=155975 RepID=UPI00036A1FC5|nr:hypothetical protein [Actinokineospora enzanensis]
MRTLPWLFLIAATIAALSTWADLSGDQRSDRIMLLLLVAAGLAALDHLTMRRPGPSVENPTGPESD